MALPAREKLRESEFVFSARIAELGASTLPELPAGDSTVAVVVEKVFRAPEVLRLLAGKAITVVTGDTRSLRAGQSILFLARGWLYGESIAVVEVGREAEVDSTGLAKHVAAESESARDEAIGDRIANAVLVVAGKVIATTAAEPPDPLTVSEHTGLWCEARIAVTAVEKGSLPGNEVTIVYPESRDVMWYRAPKFHAGEEGIWILHSQSLAGTNREAFTALDPLDFHPPEALERIRRLVRENNPQRP